MIAVGTTSCRTLESATGEDGILKVGSGWTEIFIYPGYCFKMIDCDHTAACCFRIVDQFCLIFFYHIELRVHVMLGDILHFHRTEGAISVIF